MVGETDDAPSISDPNEVMWVGYEYPERLREKQASGELAFVDGLFEDIELVLETDPNLMSPA